MSGDFADRLQKEIMVIYAPMQTLLADWGKDLESHLSAWVLENPEKYQEALVKSYEAGCTMGHTATQASSVFRATPFGVQDRVEELNRNSARLAREATPDGCYVVGNISSTNPDFLEPIGSMTDDFVYEGYKEQILALAEGGVDVFHISGNHIDETAIAMRVAKEHTSIPIIACNVYYKGKKGFRTMMGQDPETASRTLEEAGADAIGFNCGLVSYEDAPEVLRQMRQGTSKSLAAQPDAGMPLLVDGKTVHPATAEQMAHQAPAWIEAGARLVGGCCGTSLKHCATLSTLVAAKK